MKILELKSIITEKNLMKVFKYQKVLKKFNKGV